MGLLLPLDARGRGRRRSSLPLSLSLLKLKKTPTQSPHLPKLWPVAYHDVEKTEGTCPFGGFWGGCTVAALASLSPIFPINIGKIVEKKKERGRSRTEEGRSWRSKEKRREKQRKKRKKNAEKQRKEEEGSPPGATAISPPTSPPTTAATAGQLPPPLPPPYSSSTSSSPLFMLYVNSGEAHYLRGRVRPSSKKNKKISFKNKLLYFRVFFD